MVDIGSQILKQACSRKLHVCLSIYEPMPMINSSETEKPVQN